MLRKSAMAGRPSDQSVYAVSGLYDAVNANESTANVSSCSGEGEMDATIAELLGNKQKEFAQRREWRKGHQRSFSYDFNLAHRREPSWRRGHERQHSNDLQSNFRRDPARDWKRGHERHGSNISRKSLVAIATYNNAIRVAAENLTGSPPPPPVSPDYLTDRPYVRKECGVGSCRPSILQRFANIKIFVFLLSVVVTLQQAVSSGYLNSVITTIEKRFEIPSSLSGLIASSYEFGNLITIIFVSYLGSRRHIPVWIGIGCLVMGVGSIVFVLPHFIAGPYPVPLGSKADSRNLSDYNICRAQIREQQDEFQKGLGRLSPGLSSHLSTGNLMPGQRENCIDADPSNALPVFIFMVAQLLLGCGGSPLFTLGTTYIDDHVKKESSAMYIAFMFSFGALGPVCGFLLGAYLLSFHTDSYMEDMGDFQNVDVNDPGWVGMWWGGFLVCGILLMLWALPFFAFPKELWREKEKVRMGEKSSDLKEPMSHPQVQRVRSGSKNLSSSRQHVSDTQTTIVGMDAAPNGSGFPNTSSSSSSAVGQQQLQQQIAPSGTNGSTSGSSADDKAYGRDIKGIPKSMWKLLSNSVYVVTCLGACMELVIVSGFLVFLPKYLETQFSLTKSQASVFTGGIAIPGASVGIFMGGFFLRRFQLGPKGALGLVISFNALCLACYSLLFFVGCDNALMAGTTLPYYFNGEEQVPSASPSPMPLKSGADGGAVARMLEVNLTAACNFGCACSPNDVEPVCGRNGVTYFSPCHAGCTSLSSRHNYSDCACIQASGNPNFTGIAAASGSDVMAVPVATAGPCPSPMCDAIMAFLVLLFFMTFLVAITQMPLLMIVLRSVDQEERSFALGMQFVIFRLFGYVPSPIMFGNVIDSTCIVWKEGACGGRSGRCLLYDIEKFRYKFVGICLGIKIAAMIVFIVDFFLVRRRYKKEKSEPPALTVGEILGSIASLDKGLEEIADRAGLTSRRNSAIRSHRRGVSMGNEEERASMMAPPSSSSRPASPGLFGSHDWLHLQHRRDTVAYGILNETPPLGATAAAGGGERNLDDSVFAYDNDNGEGEGGFVDKSA